MAFKDVLDGRERSRMAINTFNIKNILTKLEKEADENLSYKKIITKELSNDGNENKLMNKSYVLIATGNESGIPTEDSPFKPFFKN